MVNEMDFSANEICHSENNQPSKAVNPEVVTRDDDAQHCHTWINK
jgi:hypothetical protein